MGLTTLTEREKQWKQIARRALDRDESWESCSECLRYHPKGYDGPCDNPAKRLPGQPAKLVD